VEVDPKLNVRGALGKVGGGGALADGGTSGNNATFEAREAVTARCISKNQLFLFHLIPSYYILQVFNRAYSPGVAKALCSRGFAPLIHEFLNYSF